MKVSEAAKRYIEAKAELARLQAEADVAAKALKEWFREHPDKRDYRGLVGYAQATRMQLDTEKVKAHLGKRLPDFQKSVAYETLSILKR